MFLKQLYEGVIYASKHSIIFHKCTQLYSHYNPVLEYLLPLESSSCQSASHSPPHLQPQAINDPFFCLCTFAFHRYFLFLVFSQLCLTLCNPHGTAACQASLSFTISQILLKLNVHWVGDAINHLIPCCPLLLLPSIFPSIRVFSNKSALGIRWPKYRSFSISPNEYSGLVSFRIDWFDLLAVQGTLKCLLQHHSSEASILWCYIVHGILQAKNPEVGSFSLLHGIFPTQGLNPGLPHCRRILYQLSHQGSPRILEWVTYPFSNGSSHPRSRTRASWIVGGFFTSWTTRESYISYKCPQILRSFVMSGFFHSAECLRFIM